MSQMDAAMSAILLRDFSDEETGHKPVTWCRQCSQLAKQKQTCAEHKLLKCVKCRVRITEAHTCLSFVGHADARHRLCEADPEWTWQPFDFPGTGALIFDSGSPVGMWILLTVGGVSKPGYGSCEKGKPEAIKELIGDAIRNAGQSFGIAWKLWAKGERSSSDGESQQDDKPKESGPQSAGAAFDNATPAPPRNQPQQRAEQPPAGDQWATPPQADPAETWVAWATNLAANLGSKAEAEKLRDKVIERRNAGRLALDDDDRLQALIAARMEDLPADADCYGLLEDDPWLPKVRSIESGKDAEALMADAQKSSNLGSLSKRGLAAVVQAIALRRSELTDKAAA